MIYFIKFNDLLIKFNNLRNCFLVNLVKMDFVYSFDFEGIENDELIKKFCWVMPTFPVKKKNVECNSKFLETLKNHQCQASNLLDMYDSLYKIPELKEPFVDWGFIFYYNGNLDIAIHKWGKDDDEAEEKIRLVYHIIKTYVIKIYIINPTKKIRFSADGKEGKGITAEQLYQQLNKYNL